LCYPHYFSIVDPCTDPLRFISCNNCNYYTMTMQLINKRGCFSHHFCFSAPPSTRNRIPILVFYGTPVPRYDVNYTQRPIDSMRTCTSLVVINFLNLLPINCIQESRLIPQFPHSVEWLVLLRHLWSTERIVPCILLAVSKYFRAI
jgi:hypothetical protein